MHQAILTISLLLPFQTADRLLQDWTEFSPEGARFAVKMPGVPKENTQSIDTPSGNVKITLYGIESDGTAFMVMVSELPPDTLKKNVKELLDEARDKGVQNSRGTLREEKEIELNGFPGREMVLDLPESRMRGGGIYRGRIYLVGRLHYQAISLVPKPKAKSDVMGAFLDSFRLKDRNTKREGDGAEKRQSAD